MNRKEALQQEHQARVGSKRVETALPPPCAPCRRSYAGLMWGCAVLLVVLAALAGWFFFGGGYR